MRDLSCVVFVSMMQSGITHLAPLSRIAVVIPVHNHGRQVREVVKKAVLLSLPIFIIDDGSTDSTPAVLESLSGVTVIRHEVNQGKGASLLTGFCAAAKVADWAVSVDGDGQHDPLEISSLIEAVPEGQRPLVVGRRSGMEHENVPWGSRWGREFSNFWVWISCGKWVSDSQSGFRLYPLPESMNLGTKAMRFQFEVEILVRAAWNGIPVIEAPVRVLYQSPEERISHFRPWLDFWRNTRTFTRLISTRVLIPPTFRRRKDLSV
jgi:glycosyltransferase involved in cell wall biosynthesis